MVPKGTDPEDQPNPASSSARASPNQKHSTSHTSSPAPSSATPSSSTPAQQLKRRNDQEEDAPKNSRRRTSNSPIDAKDHSAENEAGSQPMTKTASSGSNSNSKDMSGPSPYGTRSRNRGQARPNYAEDKDHDIDMYDAPSEKKEAEAKETKKSARQSGIAAAATDAPRAGAGNSRKASTTAIPDEKPNGVHATTNATPNSKEANGQLPNSNTNGTANGSGTGSGNSKKRKALASSANSNTNGSTESSNAEARNSTSTRRTTAQVQNGKNGYRENNMLSFESHGAIPKDGKLTTDDGTMLGPDDHVYLVCEPPGEPYYVARIMEFLHAKSDKKNPVDALRVHWYYRPKDIGKKNNDTRLVFATMHSDITPLTALRGKCQIRHKAEIEDMDTYRKTPDCFFFEKLYDRYIQKYYDVVPCFQIVNVREKVKKVLHEQWKYIIVEQGRAKEFTSAVKLCKRCSGYCASNDSVDCAVCTHTYHMTCVRPPLLKKPSRGFAWACAACSRAQERRLESRHTPSHFEPHHEAEEEEPWDEEEDPADANPNDDADDAHLTASPEQTYQASLWPWRYLGIHCKPEDALDYDDRIYPRAGSRLGPKHQATVVPWFGQPVELVKPPEVKKGRKDAKSVKEALAAREADKLTRPKWVQDEPAGYVARGEDLPNDDPNNTATLLWKPPKNPEDAPSDKDVDNYLRQASEKLIPALELADASTNLIDVAVNTLFEEGYKTGPAMKKLMKFDRSVFDDPELTTAELKKFEEAVSKAGSELLLLSRHVKTVPHAKIVRFYYTWKKTERGKQVWGSFFGRKGKKAAKKAEADANKLRDDVADDCDDSAFDDAKAVNLKRKFMCAFCSTKNSRQWRRAPATTSALITEGGSKNKDKTQYIAALCRRCAELWRRYAIQWEDPDDLAKKVAAAGGRTWKRRVDEDLLKELQAANEMMNNTVYSTPSATATPTRETTSASAPAPTNGTDAPAPPPRKKLKTIGDKERENEAKREEAAAAAAAAAAASAAPAVAPKKKEKVVEKPAPPPVPEIPRARILPCAVCDQMEPMGDDHLSCKECRMTVHRKCYGVVDNRLPGKWTCDTCLNDKNPQVSIEYRCVLCPIEVTEQDFVEPIKSSHKKKTEKDRERERQSREKAQKAAEYWRKKQEDSNRPVIPREPLKRTADNNWVHVTCASFHPEVKFGNAKALSPSEGIPSIPRSKYEDVCKLCKMKRGACVACHTCRSTVHVECARQGGYLLGFEVTPVKGSRRDQHNIVTVNGETGTMSAQVWCKEHIPGRTMVHRMHEPVNATESEAQDSVPPNALQFYVQNFKQADLTLTGTVRKANLVSLAVKMATPSAPTVPTTSSRRQSMANAPSSSSVGQGTTSSEDAKREENSSQPRSGDRVCITCGIDVSPKWWPLAKDQGNGMVNGQFEGLGSEAQKFIAQRGFQCQKCKKTGRTPLPQTPVLADSAVAIEALRPPSAISAAALNASSPPIHATAASVNRIADMGPWARPPAIQPSSGPGPSPVVATQPLHPPNAGPPPTLPLAAPPHAGQGPMIAPPGPPPPPPPPSHHYPPPRAAYDDWHRGGPPQPPPHHGHHQSNGAPPPAPSAVQHNHLRDLRPPPIQPMSRHHQSPTIQHGLGQPLLNSMPPSPPRRGPNSIQASPQSYLTAYAPRQHSAHPPHSLSNGGPPPRPTDHAFPQGLLHQRSVFSPHHSPQTTRAHIAPGHDINPPLRPAPDRPPPTGASASPSLRNLLS